MECTWYGSRKMGMNNDFEKHFDVATVIDFALSQKQPPEVEKGFLKNFVNFTGKHPCCSLFN